MKILVPIKRVVDYNVKVRPKPDGTAVDIANVKMSMNPFCEIAVEEAVRIKESLTETTTVEEIVVVSIGPAKAQEQLRLALAMGADRAMHIQTETELEPLAVAKCLHAIMQKEPYDLVILGKQSIDGDNNQTGQMLAALANLPQGTFASKVDVQAGKVAVTREIDGGLQTLSLTLPAIVTTDLRLNEPRFVSLPNIMKAKKKPLETLSPEDLQVDVRARTELLSVEPPTERSAGVKVANVDELIEKLRNEAKVIA